MFMSNFARLHLPTLHNVLHPDLFSRLAILGCFLHYPNNYTLRDISITSFYSRRFNEAKAFSKLVNLAGS